MTDDERGTDWERSARDSGPTYSRQRLTAARDVLTDTVGRDTEISLFGLKLRKHTVGDVWGVYHDRAEAPVDYVHAGGTATATDFLEHLEMLRDAIDTEIDSEEEA